MNKQVPWLKYFLSFFAEQELERAGSPENPYLQVTVDNGRVKLNTLNAIYSFEDLYLNFAEAFHRIKLHQFPIQSALILGYGLGSIPIILRKLCQLQPKVTAVEIDPVVIELAKKYFPGENERVTFVCEDAYEFVKHAKGQFDLITIDLFVDDTVPVKFEETVFLERVKPLLSNGGILCFNRLARTAAQAQYTTAFFDNTFRPIFPGSTIMPVHDNRMLIYSSPLKNK